MIAGGVDDADTAFTSVAARRFASPSCRHLKALSSRFSAASCPATEGTRLSGERVITRVDSFQSTSPSSPLGRTSPNPWDLSLWGRNGWFTLMKLERRIGLRRDAPRAPIPALE